jgi:peroxiredoxin
MISLTIGQPAPALVLPAEDGRTIALADFCGKRVLVSFLSHAA